MFRRTLALALASLSLPLAAQTPAANPIDFIDAFRALSGEHKGVRKGHAKGVCAEGEFVASELAHQRFAGPLFPRCARNGPFCVTIGNSPATAALSPLRAIPVSLADTPC